METTKLFQGLAPEVFMRLSCMYLAKSWSGQVKDEKFEVLKSVTTVEFKENGDISNYGFHGHVCILLLGVEAHH